MYIWIIKGPNILAYLGNIGAPLYVEEISVELSVKEILVTLLVASFQGYMNSHLIRSYISACNTLIVKHRIKQSTNKKQTRECFA